MHEYGALSTCAIRYLLHVLLRWGFPALTKQPASWPRSLRTKPSLRSISLSFQRQHHPRLFLGIILTDDWPDQLGKGSLTGDQRAAVHTVIQMSDAVTQESTELPLVSGILEAEVAMSEEWLPQVHREFLGQDHKGLCVLLLTGRWRNMENTKMF